MRILHRNNKKVVSTIYEAYHQKVVTSVSPSPIPRQGRLLSFPWQEFAASHPIEARA